jgi:hypothetical protein
MLITAILGLLLRSYPLEMDMGMLNMFGNGLLSLDVCPDLFGYGVEQWIMSILLECMFEYMSGRLSDCRKRCLTIWLVGGQST